MPSYSHYTDFLKDEQFIRWQLLPDEELNAQWHDFIERHPHLEGDIRSAITYLKTTGLNKNRLNEEDRRQLFRRIQRTIARDSERLKVRRIIRYAVASCAAIVLIIAGLYFFTAPEEEKVMPSGTEQIVGNLLNHEDIQLISGKESRSFQSNIKLNVSNEGSITIAQENAEEETIDVDRAWPNQLVVPYGKRTQLILSDGSKVWLNSGTVLEFPAEFSAQNREINLISGEIYAEVAPDKTKSFYVHTSDFHVKVYGTKFNISRYADSPQSVTLVEGSVGLRSGSDKELLLLPDEQAVYGKNGMFDKQVVDVNRIISWKDGYLTLDRAPVSEVLKQIGRYYNLAFDYEADVNLQKRTCTGKIYLSDNLDYVMTTVALLSSTGYEKQGNKIYIMNKPNQKPMMPMRNMK